MKKKTLWIHAGGSKTGTSALQNFFELNVDKLNHYGYSYENRLNIHSDYQITSGNGWQLYEVLLSKSATEEDIDNILMSYIGAYSNAICSSEGLAELNTLQLQKLLESAKRLGINLEVVFYIRNVIPFMLSVYDQIIKRHGEWRPFNELIGNVYFFQHFFFLKSLIEVLPKEKIHVKHYESTKSFLIKDFVSTIEINESFDIGEQEARRMVNRSLTYEEREVLKSINKILGEKYSTEISDKLIFANPTLRSEPLDIDEQVCQEITFRFQDEIKWVNETFFNGLDIVSIAHVKSGKKQKDNTSHAKKDPWGLSLEWALEKIHVIKEETIFQFIHRLRDAGNINPNDFSSDIPDDFDPIAYLLLNPDVMAEDISPIDHYVNYGKEEGREYQFDVMRNRMAQIAKDTEDDIEELQKQITQLNDAVKQWEKYGLKMARQLSKREEELFARTTNQKSTNRQQK